MVSFIVPILIWIDKKLKQHRMTTHILILKSETGTAWFLLMVQRWLLQYSHHHTAFVMFRTNLKCKQQVPLGSKLETKESQKPKEEAELHCRR